MTLAVDSPIGAAHEEAGTALLYAFARATRAEGHVAPKGNSARPDGIITRKGVIVAVAEARRRPGHTLAQLRAMRAFPDQFLITASKLHAIIAGGGLFCVRSYLALEFACGSRLYWQIGTPDGKPAVTITTARTVTRATSLSPDLIARDNAFIPFGEAKPWPSATLGK